MPAEIGSVPVVPVKRGSWGGYLAHARPIVLRKAICDAIAGRTNVVDMLSVQILCIGAHSGDGEELLVFVDALLQLAKEHSQSTSVVARPECLCERRHDVKMPWL